MGILEESINLISNNCVNLGANVNNTSSILGSALHVACADNVANRADIMRVLLENGGNPNIEARSDEGLLHPSVLAEYITSNGNKDKLNHDVVDLLLRHGAQVSSLCFYNNRKIKLKIVLCAKGGAQDTTPSSPRTLFCLTYFSEASQSLFEYDGCSRKLR